MGCKHGISSPTYYQWKSTYVGVSVHELKRMCAELALEKTAIKDVLSRKL